MIATAAGIFAGLPWIAAANPKFTNAIVVGSGTGDLDLYTVPTGRKAIVLDVMLGTTSAVAANVFAEVKSGGSYYKLGTVVAPVLQSANGMIALNGNSTSYGFIFEAGESVSLNTDQVLSVFAGILEFDASVPISSKRTFAPASGDNTLYTCPAGSSAIIPSILFQPYASSNPKYVNNCGVTRTIGWFLVPSGGSTGTQTRIGNNTAPTVGTGLSNGGNVVGTMAAGDAIVFNTDANTAGQVAWVNIVELHLPN